VAVAREFSPRFERHRAGLVTIDVAGLERLIGPPRTIGEELRRTAAAQGLHVHVAVAATRSAALVLALARPGVTVVDAGRERETLAPLPVGVLEKAYGSGLMAHGSGDTAHGLKPEALSLEPLCRRWGVRTLGEFGALPAAELSSRLGPQALAWQRVARGEDAAPLVPTLPEERFESSLELEWPIEGLEPLSFVLTRLLEPLSARLERRDRGTAILHLELRLVTKAAHAGRLQLPAPIRDVRTLRTLLLLDLESHPPPAAIDAVTIQIDPTPGRIIQHTLFTRAQPTPEQLSTLVARLNALMGEDRVGAPVPVDSHRPGAFAMQPFAIDHDHRRDRRARKENSNDSADSALSAVFENSALPAVHRAPGPQPPAPSPCLVSSLRRWRQPIPARVAIERGRPVRVVTDRRGVTGGAVMTAVGPWRTSGHWWEGEVGEVGNAKNARNAKDAKNAGNSLPPFLPAWDRDEWDVAVADGGVYRIFRDRGTDAWFIDAIVD